MTKEANLEAVNSALSKEVRKLQEELKAADKTNMALTARVEELEGAAAFTPTHRHKARGSVYQEIGIAELQSATRIQEGAWLIIYRAKDGRLWARPTREFRDGRFEVLPRAAITKEERE